MKRTSSLATLLWISLAVAALMANSCGPRDKHLAEIASLSERVDKSLQAVAAGSGELDSLSTLRLARKQLAWAEGRVKDTAAVSMWLASAANYQMLNDPRQAYTVYAQVLKYQPTHPRAERALYEMATIAHVDLHEHEAAMRLYKGYLAQYPDGDYARVAREGIVFFESTQDTTASAALLDSIRAKNPEIWQNSAGE